ncbi:MAG: penicillin-binding protein [Anaerolinea sp.]|nr:penicillin-binding protein [Anaerolinea sp.]
MSVAAGRRRWMVGGRRRSAAILFVALLALPLYVRFAPFEAPETKGAVPGTVVLDSRGTVLERDGAEGMRIPLKLESVAPVMVQATIAAEDQRYRAHPGVDPLAVTRAALRYRSQPSGASTITQQLARRLYLPDGGGPLLVRKLREAVIALQLEAHRSKDEILELYLNDVYYGRGAYGVEAAARVYFGVSAGNLDLAKAAYLAGLPQLPSAYDPASDEAPALARRAYVLARMAADGRITEGQAAAARSQAVEVLPSLQPPVAHQFVQYAKAELARARPGLADKPGLIIETTLDAGLQQESERLVRLRLDDLARRNVTNGAVVAIEPGSGRIIVMVGSATGGDPAHGGDINMALAPRQPGSALKPFLYAAAFEKGYTAATPLLDVPTTFATDEGPYTPLNYDRRFHGVVPLRTALASSFNVPAVRTLDALGLDALLEVVNRFGLETLGDAESYGLSLTLGGGDVRLLDLTSAYAALGAGGDLARPYAVARVRDQRGKVLYEHPREAARRVISEQHAYLLADILSDSAARIPGFGQVTPFDLPFRAAVKTGTTTGFRDNWTLGYTPEVAVGVWVGNADGSSMQDVSGVDGAGPIWRDVMLAAASGRSMTWRARPPGLVEATVCSPAGLLPGANCPSPVRELFVAGTVPAAREGYYTREAGGRVSINPPLEARAWAMDAGFSVGSGDGAVGEGVRIVEPSEGSVLFVSPELNEQQMVLRAAAPPGAEGVTFRIDGRVVGEVPAGDARMVWRLEPGRHQVEAIVRLKDGGSATATTTYEVRTR